jgi:hypothetical protein
MKNDVNNFTPLYIKTSFELESIVKSQIETKDTSHFLFLNAWDKPCKYLLNRLQLLEKSGGSKVVHVVDIFDVPNGLGIMKSMIKDFKETTSVECIRNYPTIPMLVRLHGHFPVAVTNMAPLCAELGI